MTASFTVKNIPQDLLEKLRTRADRNRRSINSEIISILDAATTPRSVNPDEMLARAREIRGRTRGFRLNQDFIDQAKREGRP